MTFRFLLAACKSQQSLAKFHPALPRTTTPRSFPATNQRSSPEPGLPICFQHPSYLNLPTTTTSPQHVSQTYPPSISSPSSSIKSMISPLEVKIWQIQSVEARCQGKAVLGEFLFTFPVPGPCIEHHGTCRFSWYIFHWRFSATPLAGSRKSRVCSQWVAMPYQSISGGMSVTNKLGSSGNTRFSCILSHFSRQEVDFAQVPQAQWWSEHQALVHNQTTPQQNQLLNFISWLGLVTNVLENIHM